MIETSLMVYDYPDDTEEYEMEQEEKYNDYLAEIAYEEERLEEL